MQLLNIMICDDNHRTIDYYGALIRKCAKKQQVDIALSCFSSGESLFFCLWEAPQQADIIYLDIMMEGQDGMETARKLREIGCQAQIVFLTSSEEYMNEAFDVQAVHYLLKDGLSREKFEQVFTVAVKMAAKKEQELFICEFDGCKTVVEVRNIVYFEIWRRVVTVYCRDGHTAKFYGSMVQLEQEFAAKNFVRVHRSYLVHLPYIAQFQPRMLLLKTGNRIPIGNTYTETVRKVFSDFALRSRSFDDLKEQETDL